jgi:hypothetical protein
MNCLGEESDKQCETVLCDCGDRIGSLFNGPVDLPGV